MRLPGVGPPPDPRVHRDTGRDARVDRPGRPELRDRADHGCGLRGGGSGPCPPARRAASPCAAAGTSRAGRRRAGCRSRPPCSPVRPRTRVALRRSRRADVLVAVGDHRATPVPRRLPTMTTSRAANALAVRTTVPMLRSCCQFSIATAKSCRRVSRSATIASTAQYRYRRGRCGGRRHAAVGIEPRIGRPGQRVRTDPDLVAGCRHASVTPRTGRGTPGRRRGGRGAPRPR